MSAEIQKLYIAYFNRPADPGGLAYWTDQLAKGATMTQIANSFSASAEYQAIYTGKSNLVLIDQLYQNLFGRAADVGGLLFWNNEMLAGRVTITSVASALASGTTPGSADNIAINSKISAASAFTTAIDTAPELLAYSGTAATAQASAWLSTVTNAATLASAIAPATLASAVSNSVAASTVSAGQTFTLTNGLDATGTIKGDLGTTSTDGNNTFNANVATDNTGIANVETLTAIDVIDGGAGTDTLNYVTVGATALPAGAAISNIEIINMTSDGAATADVSNFKDVTTLSAKAVGAAVDIDTKSNATSVTVTGTPAAVAIDDAGTAATTADKLKTVSVTGNTGALTIGATNAVDTLTSLSLASSNQNATVTATAGTRTLALNINGLTGGTLQDGEATTLAVTSSGTATTGITVNAAKATTVSINAAVATTIADVNIGAATTLTVTGAGATTVTATTTVTALTSIDSTNSAGGLTVTAAIGTGVNFTGGDGKDAVTLGATTKAITTGGGDDTVTLNAVAALGPNGSVDAGGGTADTLVFNTYANAVTASGATTFAPTVSGFERLEFSGVNAAAAAAINLANLDAINHVTLSAVNTETTTISNMGANGTIVFKASQTTAKPVTVTLTDSAGASDVLNVVLSKATATALVGLTAANIETVNVTSTETATTLLGTVTHGVEALVIADAKTLTISGNAGVTITTLTGTAMTSIDASGVTAGLVSFTTGALAAASTIKGGAAANTIVASAATKAVTYTGQDKVDTITINNALNNVVNTGGDADIIVTGTGADTINGGLGNDSITSGAGLDSLTGGGGNDTFILTLNANGTTYASIKDANAGDIIQVTDKGTEVSINGGTTMGAKVTLGGNALFTDYLNAAAVTAVTPATNGVWSWFQFGGNTYVVADQTNATTFTAATDFVVELTGLVDLTNSTGVGTNAITII